jgi:hypothetical protein
MFENRIMQIHKTFPKPVFACPGAAAQWQAFSLSLSRAARLSFFEQFQGVFRDVGTTRTD